MVSKLDKEAKEKQHFIRSINALKAYNQELLQKEALANLKAHHAKKAARLSQQQIQQLENINKILEELSQNLPNAVQVPLPGLLAKQVKEALEAKNYTNIDIVKLEQGLSVHNENVKSSFLNGDIWFTPDSSYKTLLQNPKKFKPKFGGAKNTGLRTGVYTFEHGTEKEMMLIKQGADAGETIAEYLGGLLYDITIPDHSAKCILTRDTTMLHRSINDVYVGSVYAKGTKVEDAFKAVGFDARDPMAAPKAWFKKIFGSRQESVMRKVLKVNEEQADNTLAMSAANVLWHGDHDFHTGNFVLVDYKDKGVDKKKFVKIDHGFSFFNFDKDVVDIFNPFAGKVFDISIKRFFRGGKLIEMYPFNHFWDFAVETKGFYFNNNFIKACEDIGNVKPEEIRKKIHDGLENVRVAYAENSVEALTLFGTRVGLKPEQFIEDKYNPDPQDMAQRIEDFMVARLVKRQASMLELADKCRAQTQLLDKDRREYSGKFNDRIIFALDALKDIEDNRSKMLKHQQFSNREAKYQALKDKESRAQSYRNQEDALHREIELLKLLQQANDLGILEVNNKGEFILQSEFYLHNSGERQIITPAEFKQKMDDVVAFSGYKSQINLQKIDFQQKIPLTDTSMNLLDEIRDHLRKKQQPGSKVAPKI